MAIKFFKDNQIKDLSNIGYLALATILDKTYPVGCYFEISDANFNPNEEFVGEWVEDTKGQVMMSRNPNSTVESYREAGNNVGNYNVTLTVNNLPSHSHTFTGKAHNHDLGSHTHSYAKSASSTGGHSLTVAQLPAHRHYMTSTGGGEANGGKVLANQQIAMYAISANTDLPYSLRSNANEATLGRTSSVGSGSSHNHSITLTATNTVAASGNTGNATQGGTIGNTGSGQQFSVVQYSKTCVRWHRIS